MKVNNSKSETCEFILNPQAQTELARISDRLHIKDEKSGMSLPIQFAADIISGQAKIEVKTQTQDINGTPLIITNIGDTELRIFDVDFKNQRFYLTPYLTSQQQTLLPGESMNKVIVVRKTISLMGKSKVQDTLTIRLNDPQYPKGIYEQDISVNIRRRFLNFRR